MKEKDRYGSTKTSSFAIKALPEGWELYEKIDLTRDRKIQKILLVWTIAMIVCMTVPMLFFHPLSAIAELSAGELAKALAAMLISMVVYILLHEGVHGIFIQLFTGEKPSFGMELKKGVFYAGSDRYFRKTPYIIIALAPLAVWTLVIGMLLGDIEEKYFWFLYAVQIFNVTGAAGDIYVAYRAATMPSGILIRDFGAEMDFYLRKKFL